MPAVVFFIVIPGLITLDPLNMIFLIILTLILDAVVRISPRLFDREEILVHWK